MQKLIWLSFEINLPKGQLFIPETKLTNFCELLELLSHIEVVQAELFASLIGKIVSMSLALGPVTRLMTQSMYAVLNSRGS